MDSVSNLWQLILCKFWPLLATFYLCKENWTYVSTQYWDFHNFFKFPKRQLIQINLYRLIFILVDFNFCLTRGESNFNKNFVKLKNILTRIKVVFFNQNDHQGKMFNTQKHMHEGGFSWLNGNSVMCEICRIFLFFSVEQLWMDAFKIFLI